jgi:DNA-binding beta-propeller fold protein YncE
MRIRRLTAVVLAVTGVMVVGGLLSSAAAVAATGYGLVSSFGSFGKVRGIAVNESTKDVYVLDGSGGGSVYKFDSTG